MSMPRIVLCARDTPLERWIEALKVLLPDCEVYGWAAADSRQADYAVVWAPPPEFFATQLQLKAVFNLGAGVDALMRLPNLPDGVTVVRLCDAGMAVQMAEYV